MSKRFFRGDAPSQAQVWRLRRPLITGTVQLRVGSKTLEFGNWSAATIVNAWNASRWPECRSAVASVSGDDVLLTARTPGVPFYVWVTVGGVSYGQGTSHNEVHYIALVHSPDGGTFNWAQFGDDVDIAFDATAAALQASLESLDAFSPGDVSVTGAAGGPWLVEYTGRYAGQHVPLPVLNGSNLTGGDAAAVIHTVQNGSATSGGTVSRSFAADSIAYVDDYDNPSSTYGTDAFRIATEDPYNLPNERWPRAFVSFILDLPRGQAVTAASIQLILSGFYGYHDAYFQGTLFAEDADNPSVPSSGADMLGRPWMAPGVDVAFPPYGWSVGSPFQIVGLASLIQAVISRPGWTPGNRINLHLRAATTSQAVVEFNRAGSAYSDPPVLTVDYSSGVREIQSVMLSGSPRSGSVTLSLGGTPFGALPHTATAAQAQAAAEAVVGSGLVTCTGGPWPSEILFSFDAGLGDVAQMTAADTLNNGDVTASTQTRGGPDVEVVEEQRSRGPNHVDDPLNWEDETGAFAVPETGSQIYIPAGKVDLLYGLRWRSSFTVDVITDRLIFSEHQLSLWDGQAVEVINEGGTLPGGLVAGTTYYIRDLIYPYCRLATTPDGPPVDITSAGTGTHTLGVRLTLIEMDSRYVGKLGLPRANKDGYIEYRPRFLEAWIDAAKIGVGNGSGPARCHLHTGQRPLIYQQQRTSGGTDGAPAAQLICAGAGNRLEILSGEFGLAIDPEQAAQFDSLIVRGGNVLIGKNVAAGAIERTGGTVQSLGATVDGTLVL